MMKKLLIYFLSLFIVSTSFAKEPITDFNETIFDFGELWEENGSATHVFNFINKGDGPLIIYKAVSSCGCTTPYYSKKPIAPGDSGEIKVKYSTIGRPGAFYKTITLYTNEEKKNNKAILHIKGKVIPRVRSVKIEYPKNINGLRLKRNHISILNAKTGSIKTEKIEMINTTDKDLSISFRKVPSHMEVIASNEVLKPKEHGVITVKYFPSKANDYGKREDRFYVIINRKPFESNDNEITVSAFITEDFSFLSKKDIREAPVIKYSSQRVSLGNMKRNETKSGYTFISNSGKKPLIIRKIASEYKYLRAEPENSIVKPGKSTKVKITFNSGNMENNAILRLTVFSNDPQNSMTRIFVTANIQK